MSSDPFAAYSLPLGLTEGVDLPLPGTPAVFRVKLPANMDETYQLRVMTKLSSSMEIDPETGEFRRKAISGPDLQQARRAVFFETCILSASGLPSDMTSDEFFAKYPLAAREIFVAATELADRVDEETTAALGKLKPMPNGAPSGQVK